VDPVLSVIMPTYDGARWLGAALESVRAEGADGLEVVLVDDGSTDATLQIAARFARELPLRILAPGRSGSWVAATNHGLAAARGEWACFLHQDDLWRPGRLRAVRAALPRVEGALLFHPAEFVGPDGAALGRWSCPVAPGRVSPDELVERLLVQNFIAIPAPVFRRAAALEGGGLDPSLWFTADWDLWLRLAARGPALVLGEPLAAFRVHPEAQTLARPARQEEMRRQLATVLDRHLPRWPASGRRRARVARAARASVEVNAALAAAARGERVRWGPAAGALLELGPAGWHRYLHDSRLVERVGARLRLRREGTMSVGSFVRSLFGPAEPFVARAYRGFFFDAAALVELLRRGGEPGRVLELGCGEGQVTELLARAFPRAEIVGVDVTPRVGRLYAGDRRRVTFARKPMAALAAERPAPFDLVLVCDVLHHVPPAERAALLRDAATVLAPGGRFAVKDWDAGRVHPVHALQYLSDRFLTQDRVSYLTRAELEGLLEANVGPVVERATVRPWRNNSVLVARPR
jgi:SAM-dependent methyltransferase